MLVGIRICWVGRSPEPLLKLRNLPLSMRITGSAMILVALAALVLLFVEELHLREVYSGQRSAHLEEAFRTNELRLTQAFETLRRDVQFLAHTPPISGVIRAGKNNGYDRRDGNTLRQWQDRLRQIITPFLQAHPEYYEVAYIAGDANYREIVRVNSHDGHLASPPSDMFQSAAEQDDYAATLRLPHGRVHLSQITLHRHDDPAGLLDSPAIRASVPVFDADGKVFGLMVLGMELQSLLESSASGVPSGVVTYIADSSDYYLLDPGGLRRQPPAETGLGGIRSDFPVLAPLLEANAPDYLPLRKLSSGSGARYLSGGRVHYDPDDPSRFLLLAYAVSDEMSQRFTAVPAPYIATGFVVLLAVCGVVLLLLRRTFAPLGQLTDAAAAITAGNRNIALPTGSGGEIGSLTRAIGMMLTELSRREREIVQINEGLEQQVAERTRALSAANARLRDEMDAREQVLRKVENLLQRNQTLMKTAMDGIHLLDREGNLVEASPSFCRMLGYSESEMIGLNVADWDALWTAEELRPRFGELMGQSILIETQHRRRDGTIFEVEIACSGVEIHGQPYVYAASRDISERKRAEVVMKQHRVILETARDGFWLTDMNGVLLEANESYARISGYSVQELVGMHVSQLEAKEEPEEVAAHIERLAGQGHDRFETRHRCKDGREIDIEISVTYLPETQRFCVFCHDITARKHAEQELQHRQELLNEAQRLGKLGSWELDVTTGVLLWSDEVYRIFELNPQHFSPCYETFLQVVHPQDRERVAQAYQQSLLNRQPYNVEHRLLFADERVKWVREHCTTTFDQAGQPLRSVGMVQDITERKNAEAEIRALALHDQLTGLPNRRFFLEQLPVALAASLRHHNYGALLFIDMDNFKQLNDTLGHEAGDRMLVEVADRLRTGLRDVDMAFRFGGDEFVVLIEELGSVHEDALERVSLVAEKIRESLAHPYAIDNTEHRSSPSIGVALFCGREDSVDRLLQRADSAMYRAKNSGRNKVCLSSLELGAIKRDGQG